MEENNTMPKAGSKSAIWDIASFSVILAAIFLLPIFFWGSPTFPFQFGKAYVAIGATVLAAILWAIARLRSGSLTLPRHAVFISMVGVVVALFLSSIFSVGVPASLIGSGAEVGTFGFLAAMFALSFLVFSQNRTRDRIFYTYLALFASFLLVSVFHLARLMLGPGFLSFGIFTSAISNTVGKWNDLGIIFGLGAILSLITLELAAVKKNLQIILYVLLAFSAFFLVLVNAMSVWVALALFSLMLFIYQASFARRNSTEGRKGLPVLPLVALVVSALMIIPIGRDSNQSMRYVGTFVNDKIASKFSILHLEVRPTWASTYDIGKKALLTDPIFGSGPNHFTERWLENKPTGVNGTAFWNADFNYGIGLLPTLFATTGILGIISWLAFLILFLYAGFRAILSGIADPFSRYLVFSSFFSSLFLWLFTLLYVPSVVPVALAFIFTGIFFGALAESGALKTRELVFVENPRSGFAVVLALVFFIVLSVVTGYVYTSKFSAARAFQKGVYAFNVKGNAAEAESYFKQAADTSSTDTYYRFLSEISLIKVNTLLAQPVNPSTQEAAQRDFLTLVGQAKQYAEKAVDSAPTNYQNWLSLGRVYEALVPVKGAEGAYAQASAAYGKALERNPHSPEIYLTMARLEVANPAKTDNKKAREYIGKALSEKNNYTEAVFFLSQIEVAEGNNAQAIKSVEASIYLSPQEPVLYFQLGLLKYNTKDYKGAIQALEQARVLNPDYANARYFLGLAYDKDGRTKEAIAEFKRIAELNPGNTEVTQIIKNLTEGRAPFANTNPPPPAPEKRGKLPVSEPTEPAGADN